MAGRLRRWRDARRQRRRAQEVHSDAGTTRIDTAPVDIAPDDPALVHFQNAGGPVDLDAIGFESPSVRTLRAAGVKLVVPLVAQGELIGLVNLGPRLSEQDYTSDDRKLLASLAGQAAPALRVAQLIRQQETEAVERERIAQELRVATLIQQHFLPQQLPQPKDWQVAALYRPAREVGGDFYDFVELSDNRLGVFVGDVTDKGVPAALVMASTRAVLRAAAQRLVDPGSVLGRVNDEVQPDMPDKMFVTCLYGVLDLDRGTFRFANAGHNLPCVGFDGGGSRESKATGMPLGMMAGMTYEEAEVTLDPGDTLFLYSDALPEAHNPAGAMYGFPRLVEQVGAGPAGPELIDYLMDDLEGFTGGDWEQEDDITVVAIQRATVAAPTPTDPDTPAGRRLLKRFTVPSGPGNERLALQALEEFLDEVDMDEVQVQRLRTAVAEATMNAMEHGNDNRPELLVEVEVFAEPAALLVRISDTGLGDQVTADMPAPDIEAKLRGEQSPRGWGLFLIQEMVDDMKVYATDDRHTVELVMALNGGSDGV